MTTQHQTATVQRLADVRPTCGQELVQ